MNFMSTKRGFTLIELLVVIALLGIMAAVVLAALGSAKSRGEDANIQGNLKSLQTQAGLYYSQNGNYGAVASTCATGMFANTSAQGLSKLIGTLQTRSTAVACFSNTSPSNLWVVSARLKNDSTKFWCVDSVGTSKLRTLAATSTQTLCEGN